MGAQGLHIRYGAYFEIEDLYVMGAQNAIVMVDTLSCSLERVSTSWVGRAITLQRGDFSHPNAIALTDCHIGGSEYGIKMIGGSLLNITRGSLEGCGVNGVGPERCALKVVDAGYEGSVAVNLRDVYIEGTEGYADVWLVGGVRPAVYNISGTSFGRVRPERYAWHHIRVDNELPSNGLMTVNVRESGFWSVPGYEPSPSRLAIARTGQGPVMLNAGKDNYFQHLVETPRFFPGNIRDSG